MAVGFITLSMLPANEYAVYFEFELSNIQIVNVTDSTAVITWDTDELSDSQVEYGLNENYGQLSALDSNLVLNHSIKLTGLLSGTLYHFRVKSASNDSTVVYSSDRIFRTTPFTGLAPPMITNIQVRDRTTNSVVVSWETDVRSNSHLEIGVDLNYGVASVFDAQFVSNHQMSYSGLFESTLYHFRVISQSEEGLESISEDYTFLTPGSGGNFINNPPLSVVQVVGKSISNNQITVNAGEVVKLIGSGSFDADGDSLSFHWAFGDGETSASADVIHRYTRAGAYDLSLAVDDGKWPQYPANPFVIPIQQPTLSERGGIIVADFDNDGLLDYAVSTKDDPQESQTTRATIGVYAHDGSVLWVQEVDLRINKGFYGLPGLYGPGIAAADVDADNRTELLHLTTQDQLVIRDGETGLIEKALALPPTEIGADFWGQFQIVNLRGRGDRDVILQADVVPDLNNIRNKFPWLIALALDAGDVLWSTREYDGVRHGGFRAADLDGDGLDEVAGAVIIDHDGSRMNSWDYHLIVNPGHLDAVYFEDIKPDVPGLEAILLEEAKQKDDRVAIFNSEQVFAYASRNGNEPQNAAIGDFDPTRFGLEIWCRSRFPFDQQPWVLDADGNVIAEWIMNEKKPANWTIEGIEMINKIDWTGAEKNYLAAKERHKEGDIAIIDAMHGDFLKIWKEKAARIYVADVAGDYREEIIVINNEKSEIRIYWNTDINSNNKSRYWRLNHYRRSKQNYNYYSP